MEWFDLGCIGDKEPGGVLELPEAAMDPRFALELHVLVGSDDRTVAFWMLADGAVLGMATAGMA